MDNKIISGFTFIKNGLTLGYPILESILSIAPLCDEIVINIGFDREDLTGDDGTEEFLRDNLTGSKFRFIKNFWDPRIQKDGLILSQQTNLALAACRGDICQYIQGDEVVHEDDLQTIERALQELHERENLDGLVFKYLHFFGNVDILKYTRTIYRREVRAIRRSSGVRSYKDAQGFRFPDGGKPRAKLIDARIFHYGWARDEMIMQKKINSFDKLFNGEQGQDGREFRYKRVFGLKKFTDTHPALMQRWIEEHRNQLTIDSMERDFHFKHIGMAISDLIERLTDYRLGEFKNYELID